MKTEHTPQWKNPTATLLRAERDHLKAANAEMLEALKKIAEKAKQALDSDGEVFLSEADIFDIATAAIAKVEGKE